MPLCSGLREVHQHWSVQSLHEAEAAVDVPESPPALATFVSVYAQRLSQVSGHTAWNPRAPEIAFTKAYSSDEDDDNVTVSCSSSYCDGVDEQEFLRWCSVCP